jgi:hypothetical protein
VHVTSEQVAFVQVTGVPLFKGTVRSKLSQVSYLYIHLDIVFNVRHNFSDSVWLLFHGAFKEIRHRVALALSLRVFYTFIWWQ